MIALTATVLLLRGSQGRGGWCEGVQDVCTYIECIVWYAIYRLCRMLCHILRGVHICMYACVCVCVCCRAGVHGVAAGGAIPGGINVCVSV